MTHPVPATLHKNCNASVDGRAWLHDLSLTIQTLSQKWQLEIGAPFADATCSWVAPVTRADNTPAILKIGWPHFEARDEIDGLRFWAGDPTVHLLDADDALNAMLLEPCDARTPVRQIPLREQDEVIAGLLQRLWRTPPANAPFRPLRAMTPLWEGAIVSNYANADNGIADAALAVLRELVAPRSSDVLLATDLHAGNVLAAQREPWLVIDPKPFIGDRAFDATQHLCNNLVELNREPLERIATFATMLDVDAARVRQWMFVRLVVDSREFGALNVPETIRLLAP